MLRRAVLQSLATLFAVQPFARLKLGAQAAKPTELTPANIAALRGIAEVVLPVSIGQSGRDDAVRSFVTWVRNYKEGADRGHGYGSSTLTAPTGPSPAARYPAQFAALDAAATAQGGSTFAALSLDRRRTIVETTLNTPQPVTRMPARPTGANLIADFMGFYFNSAAGYDAAYNAAIGRDTCRGLDGSEKAPEPWRPGL